MSNLNNSIIGPILEKIRYNQNHDYIVSISDNHFENNSPYGRYNSIGINSDLEDKFNIFKEAADVAHSIRCPLVGCGDLLDQHIVDAVTLDHVSKIINHLSSSNIPMFILLGGNHEYDDAYNHFSTLSHYKYFVKPYAKTNSHGIIATSQGEHILSYNNKNIRFVCFPASKFIEKTLKDTIPNIKNFKKFDYNIMLVHGGIQGADLGSMRAPDGISSDIIKECSKKFDWVICGDFHKFQYVNELSNVYYCGSSKQMVLSDRSQKRGYQILDLTDKKLHFIESKAPKFKILEIVIDEYIHPWIKNPQKYEKFIKNKICVINVSGNQEQLVKFDFEKVKLSLIDHGAFGVYKNTEVVREIRNSVKINKNLPIKEIITKYVENKDYNVDINTKRRHIEVLNRCIKEIHE